MSAARGPALRVVRRAAPAAAYALVFALSLVLAVVLHLGTSAGRRLVARQTNALVSSLLVAGLDIERIDVLSPTRLAVERATLLDRLGKPVLRAEGLEVRFGLVTLLAGILGEREVRVAIPEVHAERVFVWIRRDPASGGVTFETAFDTRGPKSPGPPGKPVVVALPRILVRSAIVTSDFPGIDRATGQVSGLAAGLDVSSRGVVLTLKSADTRIQKLLARDVSGRLDAELRFPGTTRAELAGRLGRVPLVAKVGLRGSHLDLAVSSDGVEPAAMREVFPPWPLSVPLRVSAEAHGAPEAMQVRLEGTAGPAKVTGHGTLRLTPEVTTELVIHGEDIDLSALEPSAPSTALDVDANVRLALVDGDLEVSASGTFPESKLGSLVVPPLRAEVDYARGKVTGNARLLEPTLPATASFELSPGGKLAFDAKTDGLELRGLERYGVAAEGRAALRARGSLEGGRLAVDVDATLASPRVDAVSARSIAVRGHVEGPASEPKQLKLDATVTGEGLDAGGMKLATFRATAEGSVERQAWLVQGASVDGGTLEASAALAPRAGPELSGVRVVSRRGDAETAITAERVTLEPGGVSVQELSLRAGKGGVRGSIASRGGRRVIDLTIADLDLQSLLRSFGLASGGVAGRIDGRVELEERGHERTGQARFELTGGALPPLEGIKAQLIAEFAGADVKARAEISVPDLVTATIVATGGLERSVFDPDALHALTGEATLAFSDLELERAGKAFSGTTGLKLAGRADAKVRLTKRDPESRPTLAYELATHGLALERDGEPGSGLRLDIDSAGELFTAKGSRIAVQLVDTLGPWIALNVEHGLGPAALAKLDLPALERALLDAPLDARINAYRRPVKMLGVKGTSAIEGTVAGLVHITGTARAPEVDASLEIVGAALGPSAPKPEVAVGLRYSASRETYSLEAHTVGEARVVDLTSAGHFGWVTHGIGSDWSAKGEAKVNGLELQRVARLVDVPLDGSASGKVAFDIDRRRIDAKGELDLVNVRVDERPLGAGALRLAIGDGRGEATMRLGHAASSLEVEAQAAVAMGESGFKVDTARPGLLRATARDFDLATVGPLARDTARRVTGKLNGRADVEWGRSSRSGKSSTTLRANATVRDGTASLVAGGGLLQDIDVQALADGDGPLRLTFSAAARSRKPNLNGTAALTFDGPRFKRLEAKLELDSFPLLYDGVLMGRATTVPKAPKLELVIASNESGQTVDVSIPAVEVKLPESGDKTLIALDEDPAIQIHDAAVEPDDERRDKKSDGTTVLKVHLGQKVVVKRAALDVPVGADLTVLPDGRLDGSVTLRTGGVVPALGQTFRITRGTITFDKAEPREGRLAIDASTRAADGTLIELAISGTVSDPHVALRSDPPRPQNEIVALLLGIQSDTTKNSGGEQQLGRTAMALAMNRLLEGSPLATLQFGAGETSQGEAVSSVSMRVANKVWLEGRTVKGSSTSINPSERVSGVVDWRFAPSWSLRTQLGDISGVELRWSLRY